MEEEEEYTIRARLEHIKGFLGVLQAIRQNKKQVSAVLGA